MPDIRLSIAVDAAGGILGVKQFNAEVDQIPKKAEGASSALKSLASGLTIGAGVAAAEKAFAAFGNVLRAVGPDLLAAGQASALASKSFESLAASVGINAKTMLGESRSATRGLVTDIDLMAAANKALLLGLPVTSSEFAVLGKSATALGRAMGQDAKKSLDDLITGLGRGSAQILDNLGIVVKAEDAHQKYAASIGKLAKDLTEAEKKTAVYNAALQSMAGNVDRLGGIQLTFADQIQRVKTQWDNIYAAVGQTIAQSPSLIAAMGAIADAITGTSDVVQDLGGYINRMVLGAVESLGYLVNAFDSVRLAALAVQTLPGRGAAFLVENSPFGQFARKGIDDYRSAVAKATDDILNSNQKHINGLEGLGQRVKQAIEDQHAMANALHNTAKAAGSAGSGVSGLADKIATLKVTAPLSMKRDFWGAGPQGGWDSAGTLTAGTKNYTSALWSDPSKFMPMELAGNIHVSAASATFTKASTSAAQALQAFANIAATSGSKLGKGLASILGQGAGLAGGISGLKSMSGLSGLTGVIGKAGMYGQIAASSIGIISGIFGMFKKKPKEPPPEPPKQATAEAWRSFVTDQQGKGAAGVLAGVSGIKVTTPEDMAAQASIASQSFWAMFKTQGLIKAADAFKAVRDKMIETFKAAGADDGAIAAMIGPMSGLVDLAGNESFRGAADGATGFAEALAAISNEQLPMSIDQFKAFEQQAVQGFEQMKQAAIDQGMSMEDAIKSAAQGSGVFLTTIKDAAAKYGFELGDSQKLFDAASGAGVAFAGSSQERLILSLDRLTETLGGAPPKFEQAMVAGADKFGRSPRVGLGADDAGVRGGIDAEQVGTVIAGKLNAALDKLSAVIAGQDINLSVDVPIDGGDLLASFTERIARGGAAGNRFREVLAE